MFSGLALLIPVQQKKCIVNPVANLHGPEGEVQMMHSNEDKFVDHLNAKKTAAPLVESHGASPHLESCDVEINTSMQYLTEKVLDSAARSSFLLLNPPAAGKIAEAMIKNTEERDPKALHGFKFRPENVCV